MVRPDSLSLTSHHLQQQKTFNSQKGNPRRKPQNNSDSTPDTAGPNGIACGRHQRRTSSLISFRMDGLSCCCLNRVPMMAHSPRSWSSSETVTTGTPAGGGRGGGGDGVKQALGGGGDG